MWGIHRFPLGVHRWKLLNHNLREWGIFFSVIDHTGVGWMSVLHIIGFSKYLPVYSD